MRTNGKSGLRREGQSVNIAEVKAMKKGIIALLAVCAAAAWGTDLNPLGGNVCGSGTINTDPSTVTGDAQFGLIYDNLSVKIGSGEVWKINTDDGTWWSSGTLPNRNYAYLMVKFHKPSGYSSGTLYWQVKVQGYEDVYAYRWNKSPTPHQWTYMNKNGGGGVGSDPPTKTYTIPSSYFDGNGDLWLLFKAGGSPDWLMCDVTDIHW